MRKPRIVRSAEIIDEMLEGLESGQTLTSICNTEPMPEISTVQKWAREDAELDEAIHRARIRGYLIQRDRAIDALNGIIEGDDSDPKRLQAVVSAARDLNHNTVAMLTRLDRRYSDKAEVKNTGGPVIIGWASEFGHEEPDTNTAINDNLLQSGQSSGCKYIDVPKRKSASADANETVNADG